MPKPAAGASDLNLATVGSYSGPLGLAIYPATQGAQLWVKYMNAEKGGLSGHRINLYVYDDGGDPSRHAAQVREAVEQKKVVAFLQNGEPITGHASLDYINAKRIPVIGMTGAESWAPTSPMYFAQGSVAEGIAHTFVPAAAKVAIPQGKTKLGTIVCVEAETCNQTDGAMAADAPKFGFQQVYRGRSTVAQPDFTAECLAARNAGVQVLYIILEQASVLRVATACARQAYHPMYAIVGQGSADWQKDEAVLDGAMTATTTFSYIQSGTPATDEYQHAYKLYGKGLTFGNGPPLGWTAGKLLEKAAAALPEPPTNVAILAGLWTVKNASLGGLTYALTFTAEKPTAVRSCWFTQVIKNKAWTSPDNFTMHCA